MIPFGIMKNLIVIDNQRVNAGARTPRRNRITGKFPAGGPGSWK